MNLIFFVGLAKTKVHRSEGRTLFIVSIEPSKNKLDRLMNKIYLFTFANCLIPKTAF